MPWLGLLATVAWNYSRHRRGLSTICAVTRRHIGPRAFLLGWAALTVYMVHHILTGYPKEQ